MPPEGFGRFEKVLRLGEGRRLKRLAEQAAYITSLEPDFEVLTDAELLAKTVEFKERVANGESLDDVLYEAFAAVREARKRESGQRLFDVQLMGGIDLHDGDIAEMKTGEGKTFVASAPLYLNALTGENVHLVTVNDYLAKRDAEWNRPVFERLGITVGAIENNQSFEARKAAYDADGHAEGVVDEAHPIGVALREVVVDRHEVDVVARQGIQVERRTRDERLPLAGLHLGDSSLVERDPAHQLDVEEALPGLPLARLAHGSERLVEDVVERLAVRDPLLELGGLREQLGVVQIHEIGLERGDVCGLLRKALEAASLTETQDLLEPAKARSWHGQRVPSSRGVTQALHVSERIRHARFTRPRA